MDRRYSGLTLPGEMKRILIFLLLLACALCAAAQGYGQTLAADCGHADGFKPRLSLRRARHTHRYRLRHTNFRQPQLDHPYRRHHLRRRNQRPSARSHSLTISASPPPPSSQRTLPPDRIRSSPSIPATPTSRPHPPPPSPSRSNPSPSPPPSLRLASPRASPAISSTPSPMPPASPRLSSLAATRPRTHTPPAPSIPPRSAATARRRSLSPPPA